MYRCWWACCSPRRWWATRSSCSPASSRWCSSAPVRGFLELFGANVFNPTFFGARPALEVVFVAVHLAGAILAIWALGVGLARIFRPGELIVPVFAVAIVANLGAYMI